MRKSIPHNEIPSEVGENQPVANSLEERLTLQRWLIDHSLITDEVKNNLYAYGSLVHMKIDAMHVVIDVETAIVNYTLYAPKTLLKDIENYQKWSKSNALFDMWRLKRLLKREKNLDFQSILTRFVQDLCGKRWKITVKVEDVASYVDGPVDDDSRIDVDKAIDQ